MYTYRMHKCVYSLLHGSGPSSMSHMPCYIRYSAGPTSDVTSCIHICDRGACVAYISIYIIYIIYVPIHRSHYIQHYTNRLKYSASNIPTFSRRESNLLPFTPSPSNLPLKFIIHLLLYYIYLTPITYLYNMTACLLLSRDNFPTNPRSISFFLLGTKYIMSFS